MMIGIHDYTYTSALKDVHPVEKSVFVLSFLFMTLITKNILIVLITFFVMSVSIVFGARVAVRHYLKLILIPSLFLISGLIAIIISIAPEDSERSIDAIWYLDTGAWQIYISRSGINQGLRLAATVLASVGCLYFFILTTPLHQWVWLLQKIKLPPLFIELIVFTYRFIFVLLEKMYEIYRSQSSRLGYQNYRVSITSIAQLIVSLFTKSILTAKELQMVIDSRGGDSGVKGMFEVKLDIPYNRWFWTGIIVSAVTLLTIHIITWKINVM